MLIAFRQYGVRIFKYLSILFISILITMSPWIVRNYRISNRPSVLLSDELTSSLASFMELFPELEDKWGISSQELTNAIHRGEGYAYLSDKWNIEQKDVDLQIRKKFFYEVLRNSSKYLNLRFIFKNMKIFWSPYYNSLKNDNIMGGWA